MQNQSCGLDSIKDFFLNLYSCQTPYFNSVSFQSLSKFLGEILYPPQQATKYLQGTVGTFCTVQSKECFSCQWHNFHIVPSWQLKILTACLILTAWLRGFGIYSMGNAHSKFWKKNFTHDFFTDNSVSHHCNLVIEVSLFFPSKETI